MKEEPIVKLNGTEFSPVEGETLRTQVLSFFMSQGGSANTPFGNVLLDKRGVKNDLSHPNYLNKTHAFAAVKDVLEKGKVTTPFDYHDVHGKKQPTGIITGYIMIGEQPFKMDVTVIGNADGEMRLYCHDVYQIPITENHQKSIITKNILGASSLYPSCNSLGEYANVNKNNKNMKKKVIKLNENTLKQIVAESVKKVLNEDYFGRYISQGGSRYTDLYDIDNGEDISKPGNKYAKKDATDFGEDGYGPKWDKNMYDLKAQTLGKGMDTLDYDKEWLENDPETKFDMAAQKHAMRDILKTNNHGFRNAGAAKAVAKLGIPMSIAYKLSNETLERIVKDLGGSFKPEYRQKIS